MTKIYKFSNNSLKSFKIGMSEVLLIPNKIPIRKFLILLSKSITRKINSQISLLIKKSKNNNLNQSCNKNLQKYPIKVHRSSSKINSNL